MKPANPRTPKRILTINGSSSAFRTNEERVIAKTVCCSLPWLKKGIEP